MATAELDLEERVDGQGFRLEGVCWNDYESMLKIIGEPQIRVIFDSGTIEVQMPSQRHEQASRLLGLFVPRLAEELEIPYEPPGMTTWKRADADKGLEPDQCYYIQHEAIVRRREPIDLGVDPPPDLAIEVDITRIFLDRLAIHADLGVSEVWRFDGKSITFLGLVEEDRVYRRLDESLCIPRLRAADVERFLESGRALDKIRWARSIRDWVRDELSTRPCPETPIG